MAMPQEVKRSRCPQTRYKGKTSLTKKARPQLHKENDRAISRELNNQNISKRLWVSKTDPRVGPYTISPEDTATGFQLQYLRFHFAEQEVLCRNMVCNEKDLHPYNQKYLWPLVLKFNSQRNVIKEVARHPKTPIVFIENKILKYILFLSIYLSIYI